MEILLIFTALVTFVWCENTIPNGYPFGSPLLTVYPCNDTQDIVVWFEPGLPLKERNQYYLYVNKFFPPKVQIQAKFNADVKIVVNVRTANNTYSTFALKDGVRTSSTYRTTNPGLMSYGYKVKGTVTGVIPYLTSFRANNVEYCTRPNVGFLDAYTTSNTDSSTPQNCGRRKVQHVELIVNGEQTKPGDWPWHTALYRLDNSAIRYICGGTLLSTNFVLTAAHCTTLRGVPLLAEVLSVVLGKYNLIGGDIGSTEREIHRIITHERFQSRYLHNDIALLKLKTVVIFTDYIQPACLWYNNADEKLPNAQILGTIVGWGFDSNEILSRTIKQAQMPIVADDVCMASNPHFYPSILNDNKFCAGYRNGSSPCNGDSGSAFQVFVPDTVHNGRISSSGTWLVRGIVSFTMSRNDASICDPDHYVVFTDVAKYITWIRSHLDED